MSRDVRGDSVATVRAPTRRTGALRRRTLVILLGDSVTTHPLPPTGEVTVGRASWCDVRIDHPSLSRTHLTIALTDAQVTVTDRESANGTLLRTARLSPGVAVEVSPNDLLQAGDATLVVQETRAEAAAPTARGQTSVRPSGPVTLGAKPVILEASTRQLYDLAARVARGDIGILIVGETGAGKEVLAEYVHQRSPRASGPLVRVNCAAIAPNLIESELFGHERGAFTGADRAREGLLEAGSGGTVLLDEIGELALEAQAKLLRVIEDRKLTRVGSSTPRTIDVRFLAATNRDLEVEIEAGRFRRDLYFRIAGVVLELPPLRDRPLEIEPLVNSFTIEAAKRLGRAAPATSAAALARLRAHAWPGNVRELRSTIERAVLLCDGDTIEPEHLPPATSASVPTGAPAKQATAPSTASQLPDELAALERQRIIEALERCGGNQTRAAEMLGMPRRTFVKRLAAYGIPRPRGK